MNEMNTNPTPGQQPPVATPPGSPYPVPGQNGFMPPPAPPVKTRRVGTITMALCLIVTGVLLLLRIFVPGINILYIMQFAPIVLVLLGLEIVVANIFYKNEKLRYDILSVFVSLLLIGASMVATVVPELVNYSRTSVNTTNAIEHQLEEEAYALLKDTGMVDSFNSHISFESWGNYNANATLTTLPAGSRVSISIGLSGPYATKAEFVAACRMLQGKLQSISAYINNYYFFDYDQSANYTIFMGNERHHLYLDGKFQQNWTAEQMEQYTITEYWLEEDGNSYYIDQAEHLDRLQNPERYLPQTEGYDDTGAFEDAPDVSIYIE
ncbi:hypothetical protein LJC61_06740 [Ruminococcaceae bacterium OttesenSCG-928-A16]|nr:hypothetical protein [Ruminococcaceae bacterium OttesenSCG-928-A16]